MLPLLLVVPFGKDCGLHKCYHLLVSLSSKAASGGGREINESKFYHSCMTSSSHLLSLCFSLLKRAYSNGYFIGVLYDELR